MKLVVGLGNPGPKYEATRHNVGFRVLDKLALQLGVACDKEKFLSLFGEARVGPEKVLLCKPLTYMNLSGEAVAEIRRYYAGITTDDVIVVYDDMDFAPGQVKLRKQGSAGGHNGMKSLIAHLGTAAFPRVRIGIGRPRPEVDVIGHVLGVFAPVERPLVELAVTVATDAVLVALNESFDTAMNRFNKDAE